MQFIWNHTVFHIAIYWETRKKSDTIKHFFAPSHSFFQKSAWQTEHQLFVALWKLHTVIGTEKHAIEHKIKKYIDYQSAGLITFLISSPQHLPPAVLIEKQKYQYM